MSDEGVEVQVRELVGGEVVSIEPTAMLRDAAREMSSTGVGSLAVEQDGDLMGIITERDVLRAVAYDADLDGDKVSEWMTEYPDSFTPEMTVDEAADWMLATGYRHLPVVDRGVTIGMVSIKDVLWATRDHTPV